MALEIISHWGDITVIAVYFCLLLLVGVWSWCRPNRGTIRNYFLAGRTMPWIPVGASLFASNIGSEHFVGLAGTGAASGIAVVLYEWLSFGLVLALGWIFVPVYVAAGVYTMPEYMTKRFGGQRIRVYLSVLAMVLYIFTKLAVSIFAGALFIQMSMGWNMYVSVAVLLTITGVFTILGGLAAVLYTDTFQTGVMLVGSIILTVIGFNKIGGLTKLHVLYLNAAPSIVVDNSTCGLPRADAFHVIRDAVSSDFPWPGIILYILFGCMWYFCCDQVMVQRLLAARTLPHAKAGALLTGYLKILPLFLMIFPGMISRVLFPDEVGCVDPDECIKHCGNPVGCSNIAYPKLVLALLPAGLRGLLIAVMLSAIMSSLTSIFNSSSTLFTMDLWPRIRKSASERELLIVGRVFILVMCVLSILWIPLVKSSNSGQLFIYINAVMGYLGTPISPLFIFAVFWHRMSEKAAFWSLVIGHISGITRMAMDFAMPAPGCGEVETRPAVLYNVHYTYYGCLSFLITSVAIVVISLFTEPSKNIKGLTWWTRYDHQSPDDIQEKPDTTSTNLAHIETDEDVEKLEVDEKVEVPNIRRKGYIVMIYKICGIPLETTINADKNREAIYREQFLKEDPFWKNVINFNAILGVLIIVFLLGYFH